MKRLIVAVLATLLCASLPPRSCFAATLFESGTLGPTGVTWTGLQNETVPGTSVHSFAFPGVRFELAQPATVSAIGGHFVGPSADIFFGAIVKLDDASDFPDSNDFSTPDVLGVAKLTFPNFSADVFGNISLSLGPGWYAVVFGSGFFNTAGYGAALRNGIDIGDPSYIAYDPNLGWFDLDLFGTFFDNHRFVVRGTFVPEPDAVLLVILATITFVAFRCR